MVRIPGSPTASFPRISSGAGLAVVLYLAALLIAPLTPPAGLVWAALAAALLAAWVAYRRWATSRRGQRLLEDPFALLAGWPALHLLLMASPRPDALAFLSALWALLLLRALGPRMGAFALASASALLVLAAPVDPAAAGVLIVSLIAGGVVGGAVREGVVEAVSGGGASPANADPEEPSGAAVQATVAPALPVPPETDDLRWALEGVGFHLGARRMVLWDLDLERDRAEAVLAVGGSPPPAVSLEGDPLHWAAREGVPLRLDRAPRWAPDAAGAAVAPIVQGRQRATLYSAEFDAEVEVPDPERLTEAAVYVGAFLRMRHRELEARGREDLYRKVIDVLRRLPRELEVAALGEALAMAAVRLTGGTGGAVGIRDAELEDGEVVAVVGEDGGPRPGQRFLALESELALALRAGTTLTRDPRGRSEGVPIAAPAERWVRAPRALAVIPLPEPAGEPIGALAVWSTSEHALDREAVEVLETLAPYAALQLRHARRYGLLQLQADEDALTGLGNRRAFDARLKEETARFHRYRRPLSLIIFDLDHFKDVNDVHGHEAGDEVLKATGNILKALVRGTDFAARIGGEEFVVLMPETRLRDAVEAAERIRQRVGELRVSWRGEVLRVQLSAGASAVPECVPEPAELLGSGDAMLYEAKRAGRNRVVAPPRPGRSGADPGNASGARG